MTGRNTSAAGLVAGKEREGKTGKMAIIITDGTRYISGVTPESKGVKTENAAEAYEFTDANEAIQYMQSDKAFTLYYYVYDTVTQKIVWKWLEPEEVARIRAAKAVWKEAAKENGLRKKNKIHRKMYSNDVKKLLYKEANGKCALCGREMTLDQVTLDHIIPLAKNGPDRVDNLQICCKGCNLLKGAALQEDFANRVNSIFMYQMERKYAHKIAWKLASWMLRKLG